ncbi:oxaloacetate decarboxylase [Salmonella enterica subsp. enterica]|nr:oxaloacetate decarboxylase [Salmonella enterica subsp. enterica]
MIATEGQTVAGRRCAADSGGHEVETEIRAAQGRDGTRIAVKFGDAVSVGDTLMTLA